MILKRCVLVILDITERQKDVSSQLQGNGHGEVVKTGTDVRIKFSTDKRLENGNIKNYQ